MKPFTTLIIVAALSCAIPLYATSQPLHYEQGQEEEAGSCDNGSAKKYPYLSEAYARYLEGNIPETIRLLHTAKANGEDGETLQYLMATAYAETDSIFKAYDTALKLLNRDMYNNDYQVLMSKIVSANPELGDLYFSQDDNRLASNADSLAAIYEICSDGLLEAHYNTLAETYAWKSFKYSPSQTAGINIATARANRQEFNKSIEALDPLIYSDSPNFAAILTKSRVLREMKRHKQLVEYLDSAMNYVESLDGNVFREKGLIEMELGKAYMAMEPTPANTASAEKYFNVAAGHFTSSQAFGYDARNISSRADANLRAGICVYRYGYKNDTAAEYMRSAIEGGANKALCYAYLGDAKKAKESIHLNMNHMNKAAVYYVLGDADTAMKLMEEGFYHGELSPAAVEADPILAPLAKDPRYKKAASLFNPR